MNLAALNTLSDTAISEQGCSISVLTHTELYLWGSFRQLTLMESDCENDFSGI